MLKILAISSIRSEYDLMSNLYKLLQSDPDVDLQLLVSGAHLSPAYGYSVSKIHDDGLKILVELETLISADSLSSRLKTASLLLSASIDIVKNFAPDVIIYAGDREDVLIGGMLGLFLGIPTVHFFGGDHATDGHIDNPLRHATSKLSSAHFVSTIEHKNRLISLGEPEARIFLIGSVALDKFIQEPVMDMLSVLDKMGANEHARINPLATFIFHPIAEELEVGGEFIRNSVLALIDKGFHVCIGGANTDPGNFEIHKVIEQLSQKNEVTFYQNLPRCEFVNLLRYSKMIVGNSSAGLLEAASLKLPAINVGARQRGRLSGSNVIFTDGTYKNIINAIQAALSDDFQVNLQRIVNPYGDGNSSVMAAQLLKNTDFSKLVKKPEDPLNENREVHNV
jgi:UDP-hydrolysing UDP-N-acetyl-D-glucosamine 2-epimerase